MTGIDAVLRQPAAQAVGWALLHFVWQGALIGALTALVLLTLRRSAADVRYVVSAIGLALMLTLPVVTGVQTWTALTRATPPPHAAATRADVHSASSSRSTPPIGPASSFTRTAEADRWKARDGVASAPGASSFALKRPRPNLSTRFEPFIPIAIAIWVGGVLLLTLRLLTGWLWIQRLRTHGTEIAGEPLQRMAARLSRRLHIRRAISLLESTLVDVPTVIGWLKPVVLMPATALAGLPMPQLEAILAHELAHIRRHDYLVNLLQTLVETLLFYHPAVWWLSHRIRAEREHCCDDLAVSLCGDPVAYANALADLESLRSTDHHFAMAATGGSLLHRVRRLIGAPPSHAGRGPAWLAGSVALVLLCGIALGADGLRQATAQSIDRQDHAAPVPGPIVPYHGDDVLPVLAQADAALHAAVEALRFHPFLGDLAGPAEALLDQRLGHAFDDDVLRAQSEAMLAAQPLPGRGATLAALADHAPALAALDADLAHAAAAGLENIGPAVAALDVQMASALGEKARLDAATVLASESLAREHAALQTQADALARSAPALAAVDGGKRRQSVSISHHQDDSSGNWVWSSNGEKLSVSYRGRFEFTDDDTDVREISSGGSLKISDAAWIGRHTVEIAERGGELQRRYYVNGSERPYEPEGREWLRANLPKFVRNTGIGAERRVARYLKSGGPDAVLAEIGRIDSGYVKRIYFTELLKQATLTPDQYRAVLNQAGREVSSDYELATLLIAIADKLPADEASRTAYFNAATHIGSDYELRRVYSKMLDKGPVSSSIAALILANASSIDSDYELSQLLQQLFRQQALDDRTRPLFFKAVGSIGSDYERHQVLRASLRGTPEAGTIVEALNHAGDMGSAYETSQFLQEVLQKGGIEGNARAPFFKAANRIGSNYERRQVLEAAARRPDASHDTVLAVLRSARDMSGYDLSQVLQTVATTHVLTGDLKDAYLEAADRLSGYEQGQVMTALVKSERRK